MRGRTRVWRRTLAVGAVAVLSACTPGLPDEGGSRGSVVPACAVLRVVDGDTMDLACGGSAFRARLVGFDTPELHEPRCAAEAQAASAARARLAALAEAAGRIEADPQGIDRYGRVLVHLRLDGADPGRALIAEGLAVPYWGGQRIDWCTRLGA